MGLGFSNIIVKAGVLGIKNLMLRWRRLCWVLSAEAHEWCQRFRILFFSLILRRLWSGMDAECGRKRLNWDALSMADLSSSEIQDTTSSTSLDIWFLRVRNPDCSRRKDRRRKSIVTQPWGKELWKSAISMTTGSWSGKRAKKQDLGSEKIRSSELRRFFWRQKIITHQRKMNYYQILREVFYKNITLSWHGRTT